MKTYCVHVYEVAHKYEDVKAESPEEAEDQAVNEFFHGGKNWNHISNVEVMRQCECGNDNDVKNTKCNWCGKKL